MRVLILGATGMLGSSVFRTFSSDDRYDVWATIRGTFDKKYFPEPLHSRLLTGVDVLDIDGLANAMVQVRPDLVINCVGVIKQLSVAKDPLAVLPLNAMLPHRLLKLCRLASARLIHVSTDCVFSGRKGGYTENDTSDAEDLYGKSKFIGEIQDDPNAITLRTSIIGHELKSSNSLIDWFLAQEGQVQGFTKAVFSGLPTVELARVMRDFVAPAKQLSGLYHVSASAIDKFSLLSLVAEIYGKDISISRSDRVSIDRSLDSSRFSAATGYTTPDWTELVRAMRGSYRAD
tara:strand:- start:3632 stop:4498 length:867 start_codon:yes stop_codon:yes gene_type:complete